VVVKWIVATTTHLPKDATKRSLPQSSQVNAEEAVRQDPAVQKPPELALDEAGHRALAPIPSREKRLEPLGDNRYRSVSRPAGGERKQRGEAAGAREGAPGLTSAARRR
jgi:hypothetical protein